MCWCEAVLLLALTVSYSVWKRSVIGLNEVESGFILI